MIRPLTPADTASALRLLRARPLHNVFLDDVVRNGGAGRLPGLVGYLRAGALEGLMLIGPRGGTSLAGVGPEACAALGRAAGSAPSRPRHIVGPEDTTVPFWEAYRPMAPPILWERREPVYVLERLAPPEIDPAVRLEPATEDHLDALVRNSARQYAEDLGEDRFAEDPERFRGRHLADVRQRRWWVLREGRRIVFQVHVGPGNDRVIQIGGVFTVPDRRNDGVATRGVAAISQRLLEKSPAVCLFCDEANRPARRVYERVGFREAFHYRSWLLADAPETAAR